MALKGPDPNNMVMLLLVGLVFLYVITSVIDFSALTSEDDEAKILKDVEFSGTCSVGNHQGKNACVAASGTWTPGLIPNTFTLLVVGMALWLAWSFTIGFGGRLDRKRVITMVIMGVVLYFIWNNVLVPSGFIDVKPIEFAAAQLQSIIAP